MLFSWKMEDEFVSSSLSTTHLRVKTKLKRDRWDDYLCSNFNRTESWYRAEIDKLRSEISELEAELNEDKQSFSTVHLLQTLDKLTENLPHDKKALLDGKDIHGKLHDDGHIDIERLERFTGLYIHDIIIQVEKDDGLKCVRKHQIQGACRGIEFQMKFSVEEVTQQDSQSQSGKYSIKDKLDWQSQVSLCMSVCYSRNKDIYQYCTVLCKPRRRIEEIENRSVISIYLRVLTNFSLVV